MALCDQVTAAHSGSLRTLTLNKLFNLSKLQALYLKRLESINFPTVIKINEIVCVDIKFLKLVILMFKTSMGFYLEIFFLFFFFLVASSASTESAGLTCDAVVLPLA